MTQPAPLLALLTDFGRVDPYVAQVHAVLMTAAPGVPILDISHDVAPGNLWQAGFFLTATLPWLPPGSVVCAVVDPGVGTDRRVLVLQAGPHWIVAPDNGLLTPVFSRPDGCRCFDATPRVLPASATFHGRDVFAPLAARLAMGETATDLASVWTGPDPVRLRGLVPYRDGKTLAGRVLSVDRFGNVILSLAIAACGPPPPAAALLTPVACPLAPSTTYGTIPEGQVGLLAGSQGHYELAVAGASAATRLGLAIGDAVTLFWPPGVPT